VFAAHRLALESGGIQCRSEVVEVDPADRCSRGLAIAAGVDEIQVQPRVGSAGPLHFQAIAPFRRQRAAIAEVPGAEGLRRCLHCGGQAFDGQLARGRRCVDQVQQAQQQLLGIERGGRSGVGYGGGHGVGSLRSRRAVGGMCAGAERGR